MPWPHLQGLRKTAPTVVGDMTPSGGSCARPLGRRVGSATNGTTAVKCRSRRRNPGALAVDESQGQDSDEGVETLTLQLPVHCLDDSQFVTLRVQSGSYIRFQVDTGAQCNVLPVDTYKKATGDTTLSDVTPTNTQVTAYGGATLPVVGSVLLRVWREESKYRLECKLVDSRKIRPLLGRKACLGMIVIQYLDNDAIRKPDTGNAPVYALEPAGPISIEQRKREHPEVFGPGVGLLEGKYRIAVCTQCSTPHVKFKSPYGRR